MASFSIAEIPDNCTSAFEGMRFSVSAERTLANQSLPRSLVLTTADALLNNARERYAPILRGLMDGSLSLSGLPPSSTGNFFDAPLPTQNEALLLLDTMRGESILQDALRVRLGLGGSFRVRLEATRRAFVRYCGGSEEQFSGDLLRHLPAAIAFEAFCPRWQRWIDGGLESDRPDAITNLPLHYLRDLPLIEPHHCTYIEYKIHQMRRSRQGTDEERKVSLRPFESNNFLGLQISAEGLALARYAFSIRRPYSEQVNLLKSVQDIRGIPEKLSDANRRHSHLTKLLFGARGVDLDSLFAPLRIQGGSHPYVMLFGEYFAARPSFVALSARVHARGFTHAKLVVPIESMQQLCKKGSLVNAPLYIHGDKSSDGTFATPLAKVVVTSLSKQRLTFSSEPLGEAARLSYAGARRRVRAGLYHYLRSGEGIFPDLGLIPIQFTKGQNPRLLLANNTIWLPSNFKGVSAHVCGIVDTLKRRRLGIFEADERHLDAAHAKVVLALDEANDKLVRCDRQALHSQRVKFGPRLRQHLETGEGNAPTYPALPVVRSTIGNPPRLSIAGAPVWLPRDFGADRAVPRVVVLPDDTRALGIFKPGTDMSNYQAAAVVVTLDPTRHRWIRVRKSALLSNAHHD